MSDDAPAWKMDERLVASFEVEPAGMEASVRPNATLPGSISGAPRKVDVGPEREHTRIGNRNLSLGWKDVFVRT